MADVGRKRKRAIKTWSEQDLYTSWRHVTIWKAGTRRWIKRQTHKHERRQGNGDVREERDQWT